MRLLSFREYLVHQHGEGDYSHSVRDLLEYEVYSNDYLAARQCDAAAQCERVPNLPAFDETMLLIYRNRARDARRALAALYTGVLS